MRAVGDLKYCSKCKKTLNVFCFGKDKVQTDGLNGWCRECQSLGKRARNQRNKAAFRVQLTGDKTCSKCKHVKDVNEFSFCYIAKDGRHGYCRLCQNELRRNYRRAKPEQYRERDWLYRMDNREHLNLMNRIWKQDNRGL